MKIPTSHLYATTKVDYNMFAQPTCPQSPKQTCVAVVAPLTGDCTRVMAQKMTVIAAATSVRAAQVPIREHSYSVTYIIAVAYTVIAFNSPQHKVGAKADGFAKRS